MSTLRNNSSNINQKNNTDCAIESSDISTDNINNKQHGGKNIVECYREMFEQRHAARSAFNDHHKNSRPNQAPHPEPRRQNAFSLKSYEVEPDVDSPIKHDSSYNGDEDEEEVSYYEEEEEEDAELSSDQNEELKNLAKQSMVPLDELIAYYQYIQQGHKQSDYNREVTVSRQSSTSSQQDSASSNQSTKYVGVKKSPVPLKNSKVIDLEDDQSRATEDMRQAFDKTKVSDVTLSSDNILNEAHEKQLALKKLSPELAVNHDKEQDAEMKSSYRRRIRANVVLELINSERDFVKHLKDVVEGYLYPARRHPEIFTGDRINTIFANIEQLYEFQQKFLASLEKRIVWEDLASSQVGQCFLEYEKGFSVYHYYCNNHPNATSELQELFTRPRFVKFFEACRVLQNMIDISLDGFLLTPIQKICKYPLQLNELLKNTDEDHPDYCDVVEALNSMRNCANLANERKRRIEALADVMSFQERVENWFGPKLSDTSSMLIHSGEVSKMASHTWSQNVQLYLFDHLLLFAKKDLLKRNSLILKGRVNMNTVSNISDADEYKPRKSFKLYCNVQQRWFVFITRSEKEKDEWIQAFERERSLVESDENEGFQITKREIGVAKRTLQNRKHSRSARYRHKRPDTAIVDQLELDDANSFMNRTLSLPSCIHPSHVMNFVEDSRVISTGKKASSPSSSSRSPVAGSQHLNDPNNHSNSNDQSQQPVAGNWFRKMGSRKLTKSQVYNVVSSTGTGGNIVASNDANPPGAISPTSIKTSGGVSLTNATSATAKASPIAMATAIIDNATSNYDILEKRYRDHMVSEEQARLFRLNNDLPAPMFSPPSPKQLGNRAATTTNSTTTLKPNTTNAATGQLQLPDGGKLKRPQPPERSSHSLNRQKQVSLQSDLVSTNKTNEAKSAADSRNISSLPNSTFSQETGSFETVVMLSSGQVVRVREDTV